MSIFNMELPNVSENDLRSEQGIKAVMDYLYMLNEQLKYTLAHLNLDENMDADSIQTLLNMSESIRLVSESIHLYAKKGELSAELSLEDGVIRLEGNRIIIESDKFKVSEDGTVECTDGVFNGTVTSKGAGDLIAMLIMGSLLLTSGGYSTQVSMNGFEHSTSVGNSSIKGGSAYFSSNVFAPVVSAGTLAGILNSANISPTYGSGTYGAVITLGNSPHAATTNYAEFAASSIASSLIAASTSDFRLKKNMTSPETLGTLEKWLEVLDEMKIISFDYKPDTYLLDDGKKHLGTVAQLLDSKLKEKGLDEYGLVKEIDCLDRTSAGEYTGGEKPLGVDYVGMVPLLVLGYQDLKAENRDLKERLFALEQEVSEIKELMKGE